MKTLNLTESLYQYVAQHNEKPHSIVDKIINETSKRSDSVMQVSPDQASFLHFMVRATRARKILEIGCFTGLSAVAMASALPQDGQLITLEIDPDNAEIAQRFFTEAHLQDKINIKVGPALTTLETLIRENQSFDLFFIDADKENLDAYYEACLKLAAPGAVIMVDNVLWHGRVIDSSDQSEATRAIREFNRRRCEDNRVFKVMLHISDGLSLFYVL